MFGAVGELLHAPDDVIGDHFTVALVELHAFHQVERPSQGILGHFPLPRQHWHHSQITVDGEQRLRDGSSAHDVNLGVAQRPGMQ